MKKIRFGTDGWRAVIGRDFTFDNLSRVTHATALWLKNQTEHPSVMVGYDARFNGVLFAQAVAQQLIRQGVKVFLSPDFVSTPMVSLATAQRQVTAGIIITASHNPPEYSGFKLKGSFGGPLFPKMIAEIEALIPDEVPQWEDLPATASLEYYDMEALYINHLRQSFDLQAVKNSGLRLGYDAMFGAGQNVVKRLLPQTLCYRCEYNPSFLGQAPEPIERNLLDFQQKMLQNHLQWGLATDGDADRIGLFDEKGQFVDSHHIILLLLYYLHGIKGQKGKVICTFSCSEKIAAYCQKFGLDLEITKIGFKYIGEIMARENVLVGGEESGGIAVAGHIPERDGIYIGLMILELMAQTGKSLTRLVEEVYQIVGSFAVERNDLHLPETQKQAVLAECRSNPPQKIGDYPVSRVEDLDGFKFRLGSGKWVMIRPSGTEPLLRIYAEGSTSAEAYAIISQTIQHFRL
jgi:phosphomannomutase